MNALAARTFLFTPATRPDRLVRAFESGADMVIADLEDAVAPQDKSAAREALLQVARKLGGDASARWCVRINAASSDEHALDLACVEALVARPAALMLAKAEDADSVRALRQAWPAIAIIGLVETARGVANLAPLAGSGVARLAFGSVDLARDLGCRDEWEALLLHRQLTVLHSRVAGLAAPIDGVTVALDDDDRVRADSSRARALGFGAKLLIHPRQIGPAREGLAPDAAEIAWARRVIEAAGDGNASRMGGDMIDRPVVERARLILAQGNAS